MNIEKLQDLLKLHSFWIKANGDYRTNGIQFHWKTEQGFRYFLQ